MCRGGFRAAAEAVFGANSSARHLVPKAVVVLAPVFQAVRAVRRGRVGELELLGAADAVRAARLARRGPLSAALAGLAQLGLDTDLPRWAPVPGHPGGWDAAARPLTESISILLAAWSRAEWRAVAGRRADMAHLAGGLDRWATRRLLESGELSAGAAGALRAVMAGGAVTEQTAAKWSGRGAACPHCPVRWPPMQQQQSRRHGTRGCS